MKDGYGLLELNALVSEPGRRVSFFVTGQILMYAFHRTRSKRWVVDNISIQAARTEDLRFADHEQLAFIDLFFANCAPSSLQASIYLLTLTYFQ